MQDAPENFNSGLSDGSLDRDREYELVFFTDRRDAVDSLRFSTDDDAIAHARSALDQPYLSVWEGISVWHDRTAFRRSAGPYPWKPHLLGSWLRTAEGVEWRARIDAAPEQLRRYDLGDWGPD